MSQVIIHRCLPGATDDGDASATELSILVPRAAGSTLRTTSTTDRRTARAGLAAVSNDARALRHIAATSENGEFLARQQATKLALQDDLDHCYRALQARDVRFDGIFMSESRPPESIAVRRARRACHDATDVNSTVAPQPPRKRGSAPAFAVDPR
jgi:hypothetical protein